MLVALNLFLFLFFIFSPLFLVQMVTKWSLLIQVDRGRSLQDAGRFLFMLRPDNRILKLDKTSNQNSNM